MVNTALGRAAASGARRLGLGARETGGEAWIDLAGEALSEATPAAVRAATVAAAEDHLADHYTRRPGIAPLCASVVRLLAPLGIAVDLDGVVITGGAAEARFLALRALGAGRRIWLPRDEAIGAYGVLATLAGAALERFDPEGELPVDRDALVVWPDPSPTAGACRPAVQVARLARRAADQGALIVADMALAGLLVEASRLSPIAALPESAGRCVTIGGFADTAGLDAWQVAWCAGPTALMRPALELKQAMTICSPAASQYAALAGGEPERRAAREARAKRLAAVTAALERLGVPYSEPDTFAYVVADVAGLGGGQQVAAACARRRLRVAWGETLGDPGLIRITVTGDRFDDGLARLEAALLERRGGL